MPRLDPDGLTTLTFDCYGTLIDWEAGTIETLRPLLAQHGVTLSDDEIITVAHDLEEPLCVPPFKPYKEVFDAIVTAEQARCYKPHPAIFEEALRRLGAESGSVAHVAEGVTEIAPMRQLGCATVWVRRNGRSARLLTEAPDLEVPNLRSLLARIGVGAGS